VRIIPGAGISWLSYIPLVHLLGHACLRMLQFVRAPSLLLDYKELENAIGGRLSAAETIGPRRMSDSWRLWLYRFGFDRGYLDALLDRCVARFRIVLRWCDANERRWIDFLSGVDGRRASQAENADVPLEEML